MLSETSDIDIYTNVSRYYVESKSRQKSDRAISKKYFLKYSHLAFKKKAIFETYPHVVKDFSTYLSTCFIQLGIQGTRTIFVA